MTAKKYITYKINKNPIEEKILALSQEKASIDTDLKDKTTNSIKGTIERISKQIIKLENLITLSMNISYIKHP